MNIFNLKIKELQSAKYGCHPQSMVAIRKVWLPHAKYGCHPQSMVATRKVWLPPAKYNLPPAKYNLPPAKYNLPPAKCNLPPAKCNLPPANYPCQTVVMYTSQTFWICNLEPWKIKENIKKWSQTALMSRQKEAKNIKRWEKVKTQVALLPRLPRRMQKSSKPL